MTGATGAGVVGGAAPGGGRRARAEGAGLTKSVLSHANAVYRRLRSAEQPAAAERLAAEAARFERDETDVVVVGDIKRGKSSLVNALLDRPGLLPVDADVATAVHLAVRFGEELGATVSVEDAEGRERRPIDVEEVADYAALGGRHAERGDVKAVELTVPHAMLASGLTLVDTPGVGGMSRGHRDITMAALARADVLVVTVSAQEPVTRTELEFLAEGSERIGSMLLVVTRCDLVTAERRAAHVEDVRARIRTHAQTLVATAPEAAHRLTRIADGPVALTSAHVAEQARRRAERGQAERAAELAEASGIPAVRAQLARAVDAKTLLRMANVLQLIDVLLVPRVASASATVAASQGDDSGLQRLAETRARLEQATSRQARWRATLASTFARLQAEAGRDVSRELTVVRDHYRDALEGERANRFTADELRGIRSQLGDSLTAAWANLAHAVTGRFEQVVAELMEELALEAEEGLLGEFEMPTALRRTVAEHEKKGFSVLEDGLPLAMQTFMFSNVSTALLGVLGVATGGVGILAYGIGAAVAAPVAILRRRQRERRELAGEVLRETNELLFGQEGVAREFTTELTLRVISARERLEALIDARLAQRRQELETEHGDLQRLLKSAEGERRAAEQAARRELAELEAMAEQTRTLASTVDGRLAEVLRAAAPEPTPATT